MWEELNSDVAGLEYGGRGPSTKCFGKPLETGGGKNSPLLPLERKADMTDTLILAQL